MLPLLSSKGGYIRALGQEAWDADGVVAADFDLQQLHDTSSLTQRFEACIAWFAKCSCPNVPGMLHLA